MKKYNALYDHMNEMDVLGDTKHSGVYRKANKDNYHESRVIEEIEINDFCYYRRDGVPSDERDKKSIILRNKRTTLFKWIKWNDYSEIIKVPWKFISKIFEIITWVR